MGNQTYTLRKLNARDIFPMAAILSKVGVKEVSKCFEAPEVRAAVTGAAKGDEADVASIGMSVFINIAGLILEHLPDCETELFKFLGSLSGMTPAEVGDLPMSTFAEMVMDVVRKEEFRDFFTAVSKLLKQAT